jgi:hypothetical protein
MNLTSEHNLAADHMRSQNEQVKWRRAEQFEGVGRAIDHWPAGGVETRVDQYRETCPYFELLQDSCQ